jgi:glycosyltransferase involved in cell wall biosynthesis
MIVKPFIPIKKVHLIYPCSSRINTPDVIGRKLFEALSAFYEVEVYNWDRIKVIPASPHEVLLGHWHPNPFTVFRMSAKRRGWNRVIAIAPFCPDPKGWSNAFARNTIIICDNYQAITGSAWFDKTNRSMFAHWLPIMEHLDLAVDRNDFPRLKFEFNPKRQRKILYIGNTVWAKNTGFLEELAVANPSVEIGWIGSDRTLRGLKHHGVLDFTTENAKNVVRQYDFLITVGSADANPTTILEAMSWGLVPICSVESGYYEDPGIINVPIRSLKSAVKVIESVQQIDESKLLEMQMYNFDRLAVRFNWDRFCQQVIDEIERPRTSSIILSDTLLRRFQLMLAEFTSPYLWLRPSNLIPFLRGNIVCLIKKHL